MVPDEFKHEPRSRGLLTARKKKPKELAVITECCTGCAGSPACVEYCPVEDCMFWVPDEMVHLDSAKRRMIFVGHPEHAVFHRAIFDTSGRTGAAGAAFRYYGQLFGFLLARG